MLSLPKGTCLKPLLRHVIACREMGVPYTGERRISEDLGRPPSIALDLIEAQIIADCCEDGMSIELTRATVNEHRRQNGESSFTLAPIYRVSQALKPRKCRIKKRNQGSEDEQSAWCLARKGWVTQLLIRTGKLESQIDPVTGEIPDCFDANKMDMLELSQIGWWDETHQKCTIGGIGAGSVNSFLKFPRDANKKLDLENGTYSLEERAELKVKYEAEQRLCLGCAAVVSPVLVDSVDRELVGKTAEPYCYSGKIILSIKDYVAR